MTGALDSARLAWSLSPWSRGASPRQVWRRTIAIAGAGGPSYLYAPTARAPRAAWLVSPGLHHDGPDDPRMQRFAAALAAAGAVVLSPRSPELCRLRLGRDAIAALDRARAALVAAPEAAGLPLRVVSVSVGALAALRLAAAAPAAVERVVVIGGYADPVAMIASLCGADAEPRDPLNQPVAFLTFLDHLPTAISDRARLDAAWRWFVRTAWPHHAWKRPGATAHHRAARELAREVDVRDRDLFLRGCGVVPGGHALIRAALASGAYDHLDWRPHAAAVRAEVIAVHGVTDNVMPVAQLDALAAALPAARTIRLGSFAHSDTVASLSALARDLGALRHVMHALA